MLPQPGADAPVAVLLPLDQHWDARIATARRLRAAVLRLDPPPEFLTWQQRHRIRLALRTQDARLENIGYRAIALQLFGRTRVEADPWNTSSLKARIARLAAHGRHLAARGYRSLLLGHGPTGGRHRPP